MNRFLLTSVLLLNFICVFATSPFGLHFKLNAPLPDTIDPIIMCPPSNTIVLDPNLCSLDYLYNVTATDDQGTATVIRLSGLASGASFPIGITNCSFLATDLAGNTATCSFTVSISSPTFSNIVCSDLVTIPLGTNCMATITALQVLEGDSICMGNFIVELDKTAPFGNGPWVSAQVNSSDVGKTYQSRVTEPVSGNKCWGNVSIKDVTGPVINCQSITVPCVYDEFTPTFLKDSLGIAAGRPTATDACSPLTFNLNYTDVNQDFACDSMSLIRMITRTWSANDPSNNIGTCVQHIKVRRLLPTEIIFPLDSVAACGEAIPTPMQTGYPYAQFNNRKFLLNSNQCDVAAIEYDSIVPTLCGGLRRILRIWEIYNICDPAAQTFSTQIIDFQDNVKPTLTCPPAQTLSLTLTDCKVSIDLPDVVVTDACSEISGITANWTRNSITTTVAGTVGDFAMNNPLDPHDTLGIVGLASNLLAGTTTILYAAEDICGNFGTCTFVVTITDSIPPVAICDTLNTVQVNAQGLGYAAAAFLDNGSTDACSPLFFAVRWVENNPCQSDTLFYDTLSMCCAIVGDMLALKLRVYDIPIPSGSISANFGAGHYSECNTKIVVTDSLPIQCVAPRDTTVLCKNFNPNLSAYGSIVSASCKTDSTTLEEDYTNFDPICKKGIITRKFKVFDQSGASAQCTQRVVVNYEQDYFIKFPDDRIITACTIPTNYGIPEFYGLDCELMETDYEDVIFTAPVTDACFKIERIWTVYNGCTFNPQMNVTYVPNPTPSNTTNAPVNLIGPIVSKPGTIGSWASSVVKVNASDPAVTDFSSFWSANANGYRYKQVIKIVDTQDPVALNCVNGQAFIVVDTSVTNDPNLWNADYWWDSNIMSHNLSESYADLSITANDDCSGSNINIEYQLKMDTDGDGVRETIISSVNLPGFNRIFVGNNDGDTDLTDGTARAFDTRPVPDNQKYGFVIYETVNGLNKTASVRWNTQFSMSQANPPASTFVMPQMPRNGSHSIKWTVSDGCGNDMVCERVFTIDSGPRVQCKTTPVLAPLNGAGIALVHIDDLHNGISDNYSPLDTTGLRIAGTGTGFPAMPVQQMVFSCADTGSVFIEVWARNALGVTNFCQVEVLVVDTVEVCTTESHTFSGSLKLPNGDGLEAGSVFIENHSGSNIQQLIPSVLSDMAGLFEAMGVVAYAHDNYARPSKTNDYLNGVSTFDLVLISRHIFGFDTLDSPYKIIAADANHSGSVTTFDIVELRRLILGFTQSLPSSGSWRFIDAAHTFPNPLLPFAPIYPEKKSMILANAHNLDFIAVKVGDVNETALPNARPALDDRATKTVYLDFENKQIEAGEKIEVHFTSSEPLLGIQFVLQYAGLKLIRSMPKSPMTIDHFETTKHENALTVACEQPGKYAFTLYFEALTSGDLKDLLTITSGMIEAEAYQERSKGDYERTNLALRSSDGLSFAVYQNRPNPFNEATEIRFYLPESADVILNITDLEGRVVWQQKGNYTKGIHTLNIQKEHLSDPGVYTFTLTTPQHQGYCKMVMLR